MKKVLLCVMIIALSVSAAFSGAVQDLLDEINSTIKPSDSREQKVERINEILTPERIKAVISSGDDINAKSKYGMTPLMWAAQFSNNPEIVKALINAGSDVNAEDEYGNTALIRAAEGNNDPEVVKVLIEGGADVNAKNNFGGTVLMWVAAFSKNPEVVKALIKVLINAGTDINAKNKYGKDAVAYAQNNENPEIRGLFKVLEFGDLKTALINAAQKNDSPSDFRNLIDLGADIHATNSNGATVLMIAAANTSYPDVITILTNAGIDVNAKSNDGQTALMYAARFNKNPQILIALINAGADVNAKDKLFFGKTARDWAIQRGASKEVIKILEGL